MREVRTIRANEAEAFLALLCEVFDLDIDRARSIFFNEPLFDLDRKWAMFDKGRMVSILTTVPLEFGWGRAIGIAGVATRFERRSEGLASELLETALQASAQAGERTALLFAKEKELYERQGFATVDEVERAEIRAAEEADIPPMLAFDEVHRLYTTWSAERPCRLRRDQRRWSYWKWNLRVCTPFAGGYVCTEGGVIRECVLRQKARSWPFPGGSEWFGLRSVADELEIPRQASRGELFLMGRNCPEAPQIFMTDQF